MRRVLRLACSVLAALVVPARVPEVGTRGAAPAGRGRTGDDRGAEGRPLAVHVRRAQGHVRDDRQAGQRARGRARAGARLRPVGARKNARRRARLRDEPQRRAEQGPRARPADVARGVRDRGAGRAPDRRVVAAGGADDAPRADARHRRRRRGAAGRRRPGARPSSRSTGHRGAAPARPRASTSPAARFRSPTRTSNATRTRPASWRRRPPRWGFRPTACPSSTCAAGCCSASIGRASRRCWESRRDEAALAGRPGAGGLRSPAGRGGARHGPAPGGNAGGMFGWGTTIGHAGHVRAGGRARASAVEAGLKLLIFDFSVRRPADDQQRRAERDVDPGPVRRWRSTSRPGT